MPRLKQDKQNSNFMLSCNVHKYSISPSDTIALPLSFALHSNWTWSSDAEVNKVRAREGSKTRRSPKKN